LEYWLPKLGNTEETSCVVYRGALSLPVLLLPSASFALSLPLSLSLCRTFATDGRWSLRRIWGIVSVPFLFFSVASLPTIAPWAHTPRSIYLKQMLSDAAPLCGGKMRPSSSLRSLLSPARDLSPPFRLPFSLCRSFSLSLAHALFAALLAALFCRWLPRKQGCFHVASRSFLSTFFRYRRN